MTVSLDNVAAYMERYVASYRAEYRLFTEPPPRGAGFPKLQVSPYLDADKLICLVADDGCAVAQLSEGPPYDWWIAGGPAIMSDLPETRTPPEVRELLVREALKGQNIGIYRVVSQTGIPPEVWNGEIDAVSPDASILVEDTEIRVRRVQVPLRELLQRITYGALGLIIEIRLPDTDSEFWKPLVIKRMGFFPADRHTRRFVEYLELSVHMDPAAWDLRSIPTRVREDVRRDFGATFSQGEPGAGSITPAGTRNWMQPYEDRLSRLRDAIDELARGLLAEPDADESVFHGILQRYPILLDVYGLAIPKPRLPYPPGDSPLGKTYVEPDFIIRYPGNRYRLVELEKPAKRIATSQGQPRAEVTQAVFQVAEWKAYIANHYDMIRRDYPGISTAHTAMVVVSRNNARAFGEGRDMLKYQELLRSQYPGVDVLTYDDLLERARVAYAQLAGLILAR